MSTYIRNESQECADLPGRITQEPQGHLYKYQDYSIWTYASAICSHRWRSPSHLACSVNDWIHNIPESVYRREILQTISDQTFGRPKITILNMLTSSAIPVAKYTIVQPQVVQVERQITILPVAEKPVRVRSSAASLRTIVPHENRMTRRSATCATGLTDIVPHLQFTTLFSNWCILGTLSLYLRNIWTRIHQ